MCSKLSHKFLVKRNWGNPIIHHLKIKQVLFFMMLHQKNKKTEPIHCAHRSFCGAKPVSSGCQLAFGCENWLLFSFTAFYLNLHIYLFKAIRADKLSRLSSVLAEEKTEPAVCQDVLCCVELENGFGTHFDFFVSFHSRL